MSENHELLVVRFARLKRLSKMRGSEQSRLGRPGLYNSLISALPWRVIPRAVAVVVLAIAVSILDSGANHAALGLFSKKKSPAKSESKAEIHLQSPGETDADVDPLPPAPAPQVVPHSTVNELPVSESGKTNTSPEVDTTPDLDLEPAISQPQVLPHAQLDALFDSESEPEPEPRIAAPRVLPHTELDSPPQAVTPKVIPHAELDSEPSPAPILQPQTVLHKELDTTASFDQSKRDFRLEGEPPNGIVDTTPAPNMSARLWRWLVQIEGRPPSRSLTTKKLRTAVLSRARKHKLLSLNEMIDFYNSARMDGDPRLAGLCLEIILQLQDPNTVVDLPNFGLPRPSLVEDHFYKFDRHFARDEFKQAIDEFVAACNAAYGNPLVMPILGTLTWKDRLDKINDNVEPEVAAAASAAFARLTARVADLSNLAEFLPRHSFDTEDGFERPMAKNKWEF
jgi:hypothetical protein